MGEGGHRVATPPPEGTRRQGARDGSALGAKPVQECLSGKAPFAANAASRDLTGLRQ